MAIEGKIETTIPAAFTPVSLDEARAFLRVDATDEDALVTRLIEAATAWCEAASGMAFAQRTLRLSLDRFPDGDGAILLPRPPATIVSAFTYYDTDGALQTWDASDYQADVVAQPARLLPLPGEAWPATQAGRVNAVQVTFNAGLPQASLIDPRAKQAVSLLVAHWFENREAVAAGVVAKELEIGLRSLLRQLWHGVMP